MSLAGRVLVRLRERGVSALVFGLVDRISGVWQRARLRSAIGSRNMGKACRFGRGTEVRCGSVKLGDGVSIGRNVVLWGKGRIEIGDHSRIADYVSIFADDRVSIGRHCSIASFTMVIDSNHQVARDRLIHEQPKDTRAIEIGDDVWISASCVVMVGAKIENGAVIAANSVVSTPIPPYSIAMGYPARPLKERS